ncbi:hypothetical protein E2562_019507 [Oryza meyeriana var. granulata]|uniref:Uncharacterized protein n=1 Tax=Oryza meyeriana var. granulata TaxID=110450 RepID=A0A6G1CH69_9ORYZ|nr:hypothetical protein E2562_019507 [Oryza meyeriana var. granulata]
MEMLGWNGGQQPTNDGDRHRRGAARTIMDGRLGLGQCTRPSKARTILQNNRNSLVLAAKTNMGYGVLAMET